jgi:hypothetical protein
MSALNIVPNGLLLIDVKELQGAVITFANTEMHVLLGLSSSETREKLSQ